MLDRRCASASMAAVKFVVGVAIGSISLISEALHSSIDLVATIVTWIVVRVSDKPADAEHHYGHGKVENVSAAAESVLIILAGIFILREAIEKIIAPQPSQSLDLAIAVMAVSSLINVAVSQRMHMIGKRTGSAAIQAEALHLRSDVWSSAAVLTGIVLMKLTGYAWIDPVIAVCVAVGIMSMGAKMFRQSYNMLMDASLSPAEEAAIGSIIMGTPGVMGYHHLRTRKAGEKTVLDFHLELDKDMALQDAHAISEEVEQSLHHHCGPCDPTIHVEPR